MMDGCAIRCVSRTGNQAVAGHAWHDENTIIVNVTSWKKGFPLATAANLPRAYPRESDYKQLQHLKYVSLRCCHTVADEAFAYMPNLLSLSIEGISYLTDKSLSYAPMLECLDVAGCTGITTEGIASLRHLTSLDMPRAPNIHKRALASLDKLKHLTCDNLVDSDCTFLPASLESLSLSGCPLLTDAGLTHLSKCSRLDYLSVEHCPILSGKFLKGIPALTTIDISNCSVSMRFEALRYFSGKPDTYEKLWANMCERDLDDLGEASVLTRIIEGGGLIILKEIIEKEQGTGNQLALERILDLFADLCDRWGPFRSEHAAGLSCGILNLLADILRAGNTVFTPLTVRSAQACMCAAAAST
jgi:hypothetical protein